MDLKSRIDLRLVRASARELHRKSAERAAHKRSLLWQARFYAKQDQIDDPNRDDRVAAFRKAWAETHNGFWHCHRVWGLARAFLRGLPYRAIEARTATPRALANGIIEALCESALDPNERAARNLSIYDYAGVMQSLAWALEPLVEAWLAEPEVPKVAAPKRTRERPRELASVT